MTWSVLTYCIVVFAFALFDVEGFGVIVQGVTNMDARTLRAYRIMQLMFQFTLYALLIALHEYGALAGFVVAHWCFGADWLFYVLRGEDYSGYTITWFSTSLPSLVCKVFGVPFTGKALKVIGPLAVAAGIIIAIVYA